MANIEIQKDDKHQLTIITIKGNLTSKEIIDTIYAHNRQKLTKNILWDLSEVVAMDIGNTDVDTFVRATQQFIKLREGGKTAVVAKTDLEYGLSRMFESLQSAAESNVRHETFRNKDNALKWLME